MTEENNDVPKTETVTVETPSGHKVVLKTRFNTFIQRELEAGMMDRVPMVPGEKEGTLKQGHSVLTAGYMTRMYNRLCELLLVSVDGVAEGAYDKVMNMDPDDGEAVFAKVKEIDEQNSVKKKPSKKSGGSTPDSSGSAKQA